MSVALVVRQITTTRRTTEVFFDATLTTPYAAAPGEVLDFTLATDPNQKGYEVPGVPPEFLDVIGGFGGRWVSPVIGSTNKNSYIKVWDTKDTELGAGAYPAAALADTIKVRAVFPKNN